MTTSRFLIILSCLLPFASCFTVLPHGVSLSHSNCAQSVSLREEKSKESFPLVAPSVSLREDNPRESFPLRAATNSDGGEDRGLTINPIPAAAWVSLVAYAVLVAPGDILDTSASVDLIEKVIANPVHPEGINELYYTAFNLFTPMPIILAALILPQANSDDKPTPFLAATAFLGYFTTGPYLATRGEPRASVSKSDLGFFTRNLFENRFFGIFTVLLTCAAIAGGNAAEAIQAQGFDYVFQDFVNLISTNKFCNVSLVDLVMLHGVITWLIPTDYTLRGGDKGKGQALAAASFFLPYVGSALYLATRPALTDNE